MTDKKLTKAQKDALAAIKSVQNMNELAEAVEKLTALERADKRVAHPVYLATQRIVALTVPI